MDPRGFEMIQPPPECVKEMKLQAERDLKESATLLVTKTPEVGIAHVINCEDYSDFSKLCRITAYVIRFVNTIKAGPQSLYVLLVLEVLTVKKCCSVNRCGYWSLRSLCC